MASSSQAGQTGNERPSALKKANGHVDPLLGSPVQQTPAKKAANERLIFGMIHVYNRLHQSLIDILTVSEFQTEFMRMTRDLFF